MTEQQVDTRQVMPTATQVLTDASNLMNRAAGMLQESVNQMQNVSLTLQQGVEMAKVFDQVHQRLIAQTELSVAQSNIFVDALSKIRSATDLQDAVNEAVQALLQAAKLTQ